MLGSDFPDTTYAFTTDTTSVCGYSTPLSPEEDIAKSVSHYRRVASVTEIRVARYRLESVETVYVRPCTCRP